MRAAAEDKVVSEHLLGMFNASIDSVCMNYAYGEYESAYVWTDMLAVSTYDDVSFMQYRCFDFARKIVQQAEGNWVDSLAVVKDYFDTQADSISSYGQIVVNYVLGLQALQQHDPQAEYYFREAAIKSAERGDERMEAYSNLMLIEALIMDSQFVETNICARDVLDCSNRLNDPQMRFYALIHLMRSYTRLNIVSLVEEYESIILDDGWYTTSPNVESRYLRRKINFLVQNGEYDQALSLVERLELLTAILDNPWDEWHTAMSLIKLYVATEQWDKAEQQLLRAHQHLNVIGNGIYSSYNSPLLLTLYEARIAVGRNNYQLAQRILDQNPLPDSIACSQPFARIYFDLHCRIETHNGNYKRATELLRRQSEVFDSIQAFNVEQRALDLQMSFQNDTTIQQQRAVIYQKSRALERLHIKTALWFFLALIILFGSGLAYVVTVRQKRKMSAEIENERRLNLEQEVKRQTLALKKQNELLSLRNLDMLRSQTYAKHIQESILPSMNGLGEMNELRNSYIIFRAVNVISGDFYWYKKTEQGKIIVCCADSWGNGVPGAMMSMVGITLFNNIVMNRSTDETAAEILIRFNELLVQMLPNVNPHEGIDMSVAIISPEEKKVNLAMARQYAIFSHNGALQTISGIKRRLGDQEEPFVSRPFTNLWYDYEPGDTLYLFTDGVTNLFVSNMLTKLKIKGLRHLIEQVEKEPAEKRGVHLHRMLSAWSKDSMKTDDITLIGISF